MEDANRQLLAMSEIVRTLERLEVEQRQLSLSDNSTLLNVPKIP